MSRPLTHREALEAVLLARLTLQPAQCAFYATLPWSPPARALFEFLEDEPSTVCAVGYVTAAGLGLQLLHPLIPAFAAEIDGLTVSELLDAGPLEELAHTLLTWDEPATSRIAA